MFKRNLLLVSTMSLLLGVGGVQAQTKETAPAVAGQDKQTRTFVIRTGKRLGILADYSYRPKEQKAGEQGVRVRDVVKDGPADRAGMRAGDIIVEVAGQAITSVRELRNRLNQLDYGKPATLKVIREGAGVQLSVVLEKRNDEVLSQGFNEDMRKALEDARKARGLSQEERRKAIERARGEMRERFKNNPNAHSWVFSSRGRLGVITQGLSEQLGQYFGVEKGQGVLVSSVQNDSAAGKAGLKAGDIILAVNGTTINDPGDLRRELNKVDAGEVRLTIMRDRQRQELRATLDARPAPGSEFNFAPAEVLTPDSFHFGDSFVMPELPDLPEIPIAPGNFHFFSDFDGAEI
jgi:C-terminal processing protease CtpA/Prc